MTGTRSRRATVALASALVALVPAGTFGLVLVDTYADGSAAVLLGLVLGIAWIVGTVRLAGATAGCWLALFGAALWLLAVGSVTFARDSMILGASGLTTTARVTAVHDHPQGKHPTSTYDLADENGVPIPHGTVYAGLRSHAAGDRLTVRFDPRGVAEARLPQDVNLARDLAFALGVNAVMMALTAGLGVAVVRNGRPRRVPFPQAGSGGTPRDARVTEKPVGGVRDSAHRHGTIS